MKDWKEIALGVLEREVAALDDQRFDDWIALFTPDCEYWVPSWLDEEQLATDPKTQISHIYYGSRAGLEDRITRIRSGRSPASSPIHRTAHLLGPVTLVGEPNETTLEARATWVTHVYNPRHKTVISLFGSAFYVLEKCDEEWRISKKKIIVKNDYFPSVVDVYFL